MNTVRWHIQLVSEDTLLISFVDSKGVETADAAHYFPELTYKLQARFGSQLVNIVPSYASVMLQFAPSYSLLCDHMTQATHTVDQLVESTLATTTHVEITRGQQHRIPVFYDAEVGPDLITLAEQKGLQPSALIAAHCEVTLRVFAIGFSPGFAYLGFLPAQLAAPRLARPRQHVRAGSVGIADQQTGIYPSDSPGGWNIIGRTPTPMLTNNNGIPRCYLQVGDTVKFSAISREEFLDLGGEL